ncbi:MAG: hypothetical protein CM15mV36_0310 [Caudoviricetes sp.]|nr:MAG: hypothetical protein CM15mV36_0310 [Caudoviricetes sp.]
MTGTPTETPVEKVSQDEMLKQFKDRYASLIKENQDLSAKIKENEVTALKLQGAIETLEYYGAATPEPRNSTSHNSRNYRLVEGGSRTPFLLS